MSSGDYCSSIIEWPLRAFVVLLLNCLLKVNEQRFVRELATCPRIMNGNGQMFNAVPFVKKKTKVFSYGMSSSTQCCRHRMKSDIFKVEKIRQKQRAVGKLQGKLGKSEKCCAFGQKRTKLYFHMVCMCSSTQCCNHMLKSGIYNVEKIRKK